MIAAGEPLADVEQEIRDALEFAHKVVRSHERPLHHATPSCPDAAGPDADFGSFSDATFDEALLSSISKATRSSSLPRLRYWIRKLQAAVLANDGAWAIAAAAKSAALLWTAPTMADRAVAHFYGALAQAMACDVASGEERSRHLAALASHHEQIALWARNGPSTFANRSSLVGAELARLEGRDLDAMRLYEEAIRSAREHGFIQNEGLANELAARFYAAHGFETNAEAHLRKARACFLRWGADGKVRQLDRTHPQLRQEPASSQPGSMTETSVEQLDLATVVRVSQAMFSGIDLKKLIDTLMVIALEHAGAERGLLIFSRADDLRIEAEAMTIRDTVEVHLRQADVLPGELPQSVLRYVVRTRQSLLLDDATNQQPFSADDYVRTRRSRSILSADQAVRADRRALSREHRRLTCSRRPVPPS